MKFLSGKMHFVKENFLPTFHLRSLEVKFSIWFSPLNSVKCGAAISWLLCILTFPPGCHAGSTSRQTNEILKFQQKFFKQLTRCPFNLNSKYYYHRLFEVWWPIYKISEFWIFIRKFGWNPNEKPVSSFLLYFSDWTSKEN